MNGRAAIAALALACAATAGGDPTPRAGTAAALLGDWLLFYASFDAGPAADLAAGRPDPVQVRGRTRLEDGAFGRALRLGPDAGGAELRYAAAGQLDPTRPGAVSFWIRASGWQPPARSSKRYVPLFRLRGAGKRVFLIERDVRRAGDVEDRFIAGFFDFDRVPFAFVSKAAGTLLRNDAWHLIAISWDSTGVSVSLDGSLFQRLAVREGLAEQLLEPEGSELHWLVGASGPEHTRIDDFAVYARALDDADTALLFAGLASSDDP